MAGLYSHTTRSSGTTLTANIYNTDHQHHINNHELDLINDHSDNSSEMQTQTDPFAGGSISQATHAAGEIERLRFQLDLIIGKSFWYEDPSFSLEQFLGEYLIKVRMFT